MKMSSMLYETVKILQSYLFIKIFNVSSINKPFSYNTLHPEKPNDLKPTGLFKKEE